jgi:hypothetical protein
MVNSEDEGGLFGRWGRKLASYFGKVTAASLALR